MKGKGFSTQVEGQGRGGAVDEIRLQTLLPVYRWGSSLLKAKSEEQICNLVGDALVEQLDEPSLSVMLLDESTSCLKIIASRGLSEPIIEESMIKPGERISGRVFQSQTPLLINRADQNPKEIQALLTRTELSSSISFPLLSNSESIGVINLSHRDDEKRFRRGDIELVSILAQLAVTAIENLRLSRRNQENARVRTLFEQYVSPEVASMLLDQGQPSMEIGSIQTLTVLFADIRNYTQLVQHLSLIDLREFLDAFFKMFTRIVYENKGTLDKFMGDGALVIFGAPYSPEHPPEAALKTGKEILQAFQRLRSRHLGKAAVFSEVFLGIGISSGEVFFGNLGSRERFDYTVIGPDVNIAQRLATSAEGDRLLCSDKAFKAHRQDLIPWKSELMRLRGFSEPILVHEIDFDAAGVSHSGSDRRRR